MLHKQKSANSSFSRSNSVSVHGNQPEDLEDVSQTSITTNCSTTSSRRKFRTNSFSSVAGAFKTCFVPNTRSVKEEDDGDQGSDANSSNSASRLSTASSRSETRYKLGISSCIEEEKPIFTIADIYKATRNFASENQIGNGGFGTVYKGKLKNGTLIAVKRAKKTQYSKHLSAEINAEIGILSKVEHLSLVKFLGYLDDQNERIIITEFVGNGNLREHLDGTRGSGLEIAERLYIAVDVAHAIAYMHMYADHPIIHRDIKSSNILLTDKLRAKVADFGFARLAASDPDATHVSTQIKGTVGYLDPEYATSYQLTAKSDVYSFGVVLVELITSRRPIERSCDVKNRLTTRWCRPYRSTREGGAAMVMDPRLRRNPASVAAVDKIMGLAAECLTRARKSRPTMKRCCEVLWAIRSDYHKTQLNRSISAADRVKCQEPSVKSKLSTCKEIEEEEDEDAENMSEQKIKEIISWHDTRKRRAERLLLSKAV